MDDLTYMQRSLDLAAKGAGLVSPNPMVGAVLVKDDLIIGEGYHRYDKLKHAESFALERAGTAARGATLYCSLEPCCHHGRTPPCTDSLIEAGIKRAVIATADPDSRVNGHGIELLRAEGIEVEVGLLSDEAVRLNEAYIKYVTEHVPFVHAVSGPEQLDLIADWNPSSELLGAASLYDALVLGEGRLNRSFLDAGLSRERHRPFIVIGDQKALAYSGALKRAEMQPDRVIGVQVNEVSYDFEEILRALADLRATSVLFLPGPAIHLDLNPQRFDKVTMVRPKDYNGDSFSLVDAIDAKEALDVGGYVEITRLLSELTKVD
jgi:pyrimidine deaminase RibD-like protein